MSLQQLFDKRKEEAKKQKTEETSKTDYGNFHAASTILSEQLTKAKKVVNDGADESFKKYTLSSIVPSRTSDDDAKKVDTKLQEMFKNEPYVTRSVKDYSDRTFDWDREPGPDGIYWTVHVCDLKK